jgi:predicted dehydrogenase
MTTVGVVGLGLIGQERVRALLALRSQGRDVDVVGVVEPNRARGNEFARQMNVEMLASLPALLSRNPEWVIVATPHDVATSVVPVALETADHVLVEKPLGRNSAEAQALVESQTRAKQLFVGMNYRFYEGIAALAADCRQGLFGELISCTAVLGHGGSPNDGNSWKLDPVAAGGGALIDPGVHVLDLLRQFGGDLQVVGGTKWSGFWNTGIEEECHILFKGKLIPTLNMQVSISRWRSTMRFEVWGREGYGIVEGRNRSYGPQSYRCGKRWGWQSGVSQSDSETLRLNCNGEDVFERELDTLMFGTENSLEPGTANDALETMYLLDRCRSVIGLPIEVASNTGA